VGYSLHGTTSISAILLASDVLADFTNGWPTGFFSEIFSYGKQCSVGFDVKSCPAIAPHVVDNQNCQYKGVKVVEVSGRSQSLSHFLINRISVIEVQSPNFLGTIPLPLATRSLRHSTLAPRLLQL